jgi:hypothetical protein
MQMQVGSGDPDASRSKGDYMFEWLRRRQLSDRAQRRLVMALARSEELLLETHVQNVFEVMDAVGDELPLNRVLDVYIDAMEPGDVRSTLIARRVLARMRLSEEPMRPGQEHTFDGDEDDA